MAVARKGKSQDRASGTVHPQSSRLSLDRHISNESSHDNEMQETSRARKRKNQNRASDITHPQFNYWNKKGRGKAKGKDGNGTPILIRRGRIITTGAMRTIGVLFYQAIDGAWPTFRTFPSTQMDLLIKVKETSRIGRNPQLCIPQLDRTGIEPSPIDCFKTFHVSKAKNGGEESWPSEKAKELFEKMENKKVSATEDENEVDDWDIYKEVIGGPSHGHILGLGGGYSTKDVYPSDDQDCNKRICLEREEEHEKLKEEVKDLKSVLYELKDLDNVESCSDAHLEDEWCNINCILLQYR
ncbi:hypothetical protein Prudu_958S000200 [Prunus dulcis]|uniref:Uncharacterized protein n=1 Tax=Prunus dulcis TaxID=3755 RepID=A0A5H2XRY2_PRUDU|nr:hypothetical protein Prudu_958S000200 [Prunus dulcis]